jgi:hypothetical protein
MSDLLKTPARRIKSLAHEAGRFVTGPRRRCYRG